MASSTTIVTALMFALLSGKYFMQMLKVDMSELFTNTHNSTSLYQPGVMVGMINSVTEGALRI